MRQIKPVKPFQLVAGHVALDLVNTVDFRFRESGSEDLLVSYDELLRFLNEAGLGHMPKSLPGTEAQRTAVLAQVKELRESLAGVSYALLNQRQPTAAHLATLEIHFKQASASRKLAVDKGRLKWNPPRHPNLETPLRLLEQAVSDLMLSVRAASVRSCASDVCGWLFLDTSKNQTRRWCDMKLCGNRMKARNYQARLTSRGKETPVRLPE